jgi:hypothetical protein
MRRRAPRSDALATPAFLLSLTLLVLNDAVLKTVFHNALTGKLSDFAGLLACSIFATALWPHRRTAIGLVLTAGFVFWKSSVSEPTIGWINATTGAGLGRVVDYTDLFTLPAVWIGLVVATRSRPWPLPRAARLVLAVTAPLAFAATSRAPYATEYRTLELTEPTAVVSAETALLESVDELAAKWNLECSVCGPLDDGRVYTSDRSGIQSATINFAAETRTVFLAVDSTARGSDRRDAELFANELEEELRQRLPDLRTTRRESDAGTEVLGFEINVDPQRWTAEEAKRELSRIVESVVRTHGLRTDWDSLAYYAGRRIGPATTDRELLVETAVYRNSTFILNVVRRAEAYEALQRSLTTEIETQLRATFGESEVHATHSAWAR